MLARKREKSVNMQPNKKYQVFLSSTFLDLEGERKKVFTSILKMGHIPIGMESFPAAGEDQLTFIKRIVDGCDYYVLIVAGRYGALSPSGKSYTEEEYQYALSKKKQILVFLHGNPESLSAGSSEKEPKNRQLLEDFKNMVSKNRMVDHWHSADDLTTKILAALNNAIQLYPALGWVRGSQDKVDFDILSHKLSAEINNNDKSELINSEILAAMEGSYEIMYHWRKITADGTLVYDQKIKVKWKDVFASICAELDQGQLPSIIESKLNRSIFETHIARIEPLMSFSMSKQNYDQIMIRFRKLGLISTGNLWSLTDIGRKLMFQVLDPD
jgi:Domain of unknown function (DUF4062)